MRERVTVVTEKKTALFLLRKSYQRTLKSEHLAQETVSFSATFFPAHQLQKHLKDNKRKNLHFVRKYAHVSVLGQIPVSRSLHFLQTSLSENCLAQITSTNRYPYIFLRKIEAIVYLWSLTGFIPTYDSTLHIVLL